LKVKSILVSQPTPAVIEKSPFYEISSKYSAIVDYHPFIKVVGVTPKEFRSQRVEILSHSAVIFTSRMTVDSFFRICEDARITVPDSMKYFCQTEAVALYLQKHIIYRKRKIFFADGKFDSFMELILKHKNEKFLLTLTEPNNGEIPDTLARLRLNHSRAVLAKTVSADDLQKLDLSKYDLLVFYSPSEIAALTSTFGTDGLPPIATFGNGTAVAAANAGLTIAAMAPAPGAPSMVKAVDIFMDDIKHGREIVPVEVVNDNSKSEEFIKAHASKTSSKLRSRKKPASAKSGAKAGASKTKPAAKSGVTSSAAKSGTKAASKPSAKATPKPAAKPATKPAVSATKAAPAAKTQAKPKPVKGKMTV
jgi:uroporphyrinogen-III synthase